MLIRKSGLISFITVLDFVVSANKHIYKLVRKIRENSGLDILGILQHAMMSILSAQNKVR